MERLTVAVETTPPAVERGPYGERQTRWLTYRNMTFALVIAGLRVAKAWLLGMEYRWKAGEAGQRDTGP